MSDTYNLVTRNIKEIIGSEAELETILKERQLKCYFGTAPTGRIHIGYFIPMMKIADLVQAGCHVKILVADLHAYLDANKTTLDKLDARTSYYERLITEMLLLLDVDMSHVEFIKGRSYQLDPKYTLDVYKLMCNTTIARAQHAGAEVVKQCQDPLVNGIVYPMLQALDEVYLDVDVQLGGVDQRKIFMYARDFLPKIGYKKKRIHLMTSLASAIRSAAQDDTENKMSSSDQNGKIDMLDGKAAIRKKVNKAYMLPGDIADNSLLEVLQTIIFPLLDYKGEKFVIARKEEHGGELTFDSYEQVVSAFEQEEVHCADLKMGVADTLNRFLEPIRTKFADKESQKLLRAAY